MLKKKKLKYMASGTILKSIAILIFGLSSPAAIADSAQKMTALGLELVPFEQGCFADPARFGKIDWQSFSLIVGDCPADGSFYTGPFERTEISANLSAGPSIDQEYRNLGGTGVALGLTSIFQVDLNGPRPSHSRFDQVGGRIVRAALVAAPAADRSADELVAIAERWLDTLKAYNPSGF